MMLLSERRSEFQQIRARAIRERQRCQQSKTSTELSGLLLASDTIQDRLRAYRTASRIPKGRRAFVRDSNTCKRHSTDASHKHPPTARGIDASSIAPPLDAITATLPRGIGEEKARSGRGIWRGRAVDAEDEEEEGASAASYAVDASPPLTRHGPRRKRRRMTSPAWRGPGTPLTTRARKRVRRSAAARKSGSAAPARRHNLAGA